MPVKHDLYADLSHTRDEVQKLRASDPHLHALLDKYSKIDTEVLDAEAAAWNTDTVMEGGNLVQEGSPHEIVTSPANDYVRRFFRGVDSFRRGRRGRGGPHRAAQIRAPHGTGPVSRNQVRPLARWRLCAHVCRCHDLRGSRGGRA